MAWAMLMFAWLGIAAAAEDPPKFLLEDCGVRVDLPDGWIAARWRPESLEADRDGGKLYAWCTPGQLAVVSDDLKGWQAVYEGMLGNLKIKGATLRAADVKDLGGRATARVDLIFEESGRKGVMSGATVAVSGRMFHLAAVGLADKAGAISAGLESIAGRLDIKKPAEARKAGEVVEGAGMKAALPAGWYLPMDPEAADLSERSSKIGVTEAEGCWRAVRPRAGAPSDLMIACPAGVALGVVDELSFVDVEPLLRERLFGKAPVPAGAQAPAGDRLGFLFKPDAAGLTLHAAAVPTKGGVMRLWAVGAEGRDEAVDVSIGELLKSATWDGPHPVGIGDWVGYYLAYRPTSPVVVGPGLLLLAAIVAGIRLMARPRTSPVDDIA